MMNRKVLFSPKDGCGCVNSKQTEIRPVSDDGIYEIFTLPHTEDDVLTKLTVNALVGGVQNSQHLTGQAADIRPKDPHQFQRLVDFLKSHELTDQLLTGSGWLHISWTPFAVPRHYVRIGYYK